jgi:hypothetical protein
MSDPIDERIRRFEHYMRCRLIGIAEQLAGCFASGAGPLSESGFFILSGVSSYFETINQFLTGESSEPKKGTTGKREPGKSKEYFRQGFRNVYPSSPLDDDEIDAIYEWLRCGMYHSAMPKGETYLDRTYPQAIHMDATGMVINPAHLVRDIHAHFDKYMTDLKNPANASLRANFNKRAEDIERSVVGRIAVSGAIPSSTSIPTTGTPNPMMSGPPLPPPWGS